MTVLPNVTVEFSRPKALDRLPRAGLRAELAARDDELTALAARLDIPAVHALQGQVTVTRPGGGLVVEVAGHLDARVTQTCVVTLEPVEQSVAEDFVQRFTLAADAPAAAEDEVFSDPEAAEAPEPLDGDTLDLGEVLAEQLALALDPYPRARDAHFEPILEGEADAAANDAEDTAVNPFSALKSLKT